MTSVRPGPAAPLRIVVDGRDREVAPGMTVAAALLLDRVTSFRRTPGTGAPRALFCGMGSCYDCVVTVDGRGAVRACLTPVAEGMDVRTGRSSQ